jgi:uncharacterized protein YdeI (YjbR/CyaY-like superfamily)
MDMPIVAFTTEEKFEAWMRKNHKKSDGLWIKFYKKASGKKTVVYKEALDVALCYGWIDSQAKSIDAEAYVQKFTPRRSKSMWSHINRGHVARLTKEKRMQAAGLAEVERAKQDGRWDAAYGSPKNIVMPADFKRALAKNSKAKAAYATLNKVNTYAILWRIHTAKKPETRARRIENFVKMLEKGEKLH